MAPPPSRDGGATSKQCGKCYRTVYKQDEIAFAGKVWHRNGCFKCMSIADGKTCALALSLRSAFAHRGKIYCRKHVPGRHGPSQADNAAAGKPPAAATTRYEGMDKVSFVALDEAGLNSWLEWVVDHKGLRPVTAKLLRSEELRGTDLINMTRAELKLVLVKTGRVNRICELLDPIRQSRRQDSTTDKGRPSATAQAAPSSSSIKECSSGPSNPELDPGPPPHAEDLKIGQLIMYYSKSQQKWGGARVKRLREDGTIDLDVRKRADILNIRILPDEIAALMEERQRKVQQTSEAIALSKRDQDHPARVVKKPLCVVHPVQPRSSPSAMSRATKPVSTHPCSIVRAPPSAEPVPARTRLLDTRSNDRDTGTGSPRLSSRSSVKRVLGSSSSSCRKDGKSPSRTHRNPKPRDGSIAREGWLQKRGELNPALKRRFFRIIFRESEGQYVMCYYAAESDAKPRGIVSLGGSIVHPASGKPRYLILRAPAGPTRTQRPTPAPPRHFWLKAGTEAERDEWVSALKKLLSSGGSEMQGHTTSVSSISFSPDGRRIVSAARNGEVRLWDVSDGSLVASFTAHGGRSVNSIAFASDGLSFLTGGSDGTVAAWEAGPDGTQLEEIKDAGGAGGAAAVMALLVSARGNFLITASTNHSVTVWPARSHSYRHTKRVGATMASRRRRGVVASYRGFSRDGQQLRGHIAPVRCLSMSFDERILCSGATSGAVRVWRQQTVLGYVNAAVLKAHSEPVTCVRLAPSGRAMATCGNDGLVKVWGLGKSHALVHTLEGHSTWIFGLDYSATGSHLWSGGDREVRVWSVGHGSRTGTCVAVIGDWDGVVGCVVVSPDGTTAAVADGKVIKLVDAKEWR